MKLFQDVLIVVIRFLIAIGDFVIYIFSAVLYVINQSIFNITKSSHKLKNDFSNKLNKASKNILNTKIQLQKQLFSVLSFNKKSPNKTIANRKRIQVKTKTSKPSFLFLKFNHFSLPKIKLPRIRINRKRVKEIEIFRAPRYNSSFSVNLPHKRRGRGRPRKPFFVPIIFRFKYFIFGAIFTFIFVFTPLLFVVFVQSLPNPRELVTQDVAQSTKIYDRSGSLLYQIYANQNRTLVPLSEIPDTLKNATIAIEDKNFYTSSGVDFVAIVRSAIADIQGRPLQGGSTITQQLIKSRLLSPEQSVERKVKEIVLALWAQRIYSKSQILEMYFNQVPYGGTAWGAEAASETYFGRDVKELDLAQSAFLAGLPQAPSIYSPYAGNGNLWKQRQKDVLSKMENLGYISKIQEQQALSETLEFQPIQHVLHAPYFVMFVRSWLVDKYGLEMVERGGLNVITSLDLKKQSMAEQIVSTEVDHDGYLNIHNGAALITNPKNGDILAMVGGKNYYDPNGGNFNVTTALRQPGSTIKVVTYTAALMNGYTAATPILDAPIAFASAGTTYAPVNYDGKFHGLLTLRQALGNSINVPAVRTLNSIGIEKMMDLAKAMGITTWGDPTQYGLAITLGAAEVKMTDMAQVFGTLANQGKRVDINPILKISDSQGNILEEKNTIEEKEIVPASIAYIMSNILADNSARALEFGPSSPLVIAGHNVSVKTGTTDNKRDNWTIGYTPSYLTAVWVGNNDNTPLNPALASGITGAAPIWHQIMANLLGNENTSFENYPVPEDVIAKSCGGKTEYFVRGTENSVGCNRIATPSANPIQAPLNPFRPNL